MSAAVPLVVLAQVGLAQAAPDTEVSAACAPLFADPLDVAGLQRALDAGADANGTCPVTRMVRRRLSFLEVMIGAIIPPVGMMMVLSDRRTPSTRQVPLLELALGQRSDPAVRALVDAGADPLRPSPSGLLPLRAAVVADVEGDEARWTHLLLGERMLPPGALCTDRALLDQLWDRPTVRHRLERAGLREQGRDCDGGTWLHRAAADGDEDRVAALLAAAVVGVDQQDDRGRTPVYLAARRDQWAVVDQLVAAGARLRGAGGEQGSLVHEAVRAQDGRRLAELLASGLPVSLLDESGRTPLQLAAEGFAAGVDPLIAAGARPAEDGHEGGLMLVEAVRGGHAEVVAALIAAGATPRHTTGWGRDLFDVAYQAESLASARVLVDAGARPERDPSHVHQREHRSLLYRSLVDGREEWTALLLPGATEDELESALLDAIIDERLGLAERLLDGGATGARALVFAATTGGAERVAWLRERGVRFPVDALDYLVPDASPELVAMALADGASPEGAGHRWLDPPVYTAMWRRQAEVVGLLVEAGASVPVTLWGDAVYTGDGEWVAALVQAGVPASVEVVRDAVRAGEPSVLGPLLQAVPLTRRERRRLRVRAWWFQAPPEVKALLKAAEPTDARD